MRAFAPVENLAVTRRAGHTSAEIRKREPSASNGDGNGIGGVQAEKPYAGLAIFDDVGAHVELRESGEPRQSGRGTEAHARHTKGNDAQPRLVFVKMNF